MRLAFLEAELRVDPRVVALRRQIFESLACGKGRAKHGVSRGRLRVPQDKFGCTWDEALVDKFVEYVTLKSRESGGDGPADVAYDALFEGLSDRQRRSMYQDTTESDEKKGKVTTTRAWVFHLFRYVLLQQLPGLSPVCC